jgi:hypothetical protein
MRLPNSAHTSRPWRIHEFTRDFRLEDVWALPTPGGPEDFPRLVQMIASSDPSQSSSGAARTLFAIRWKVGELLGWDSPEASLGSRVPTLRDRLPGSVTGCRWICATPQPTRISKRSLSARCTYSPTSGRRRSPTGPCTGSCT